MQDGEVWLTQDGIAQLFDVDRSVVAKHLKNIFQDGELAEKETRAKFTQVADNGKTYQYHSGQKLSELNTTRVSNFFIEIRVVSYAENLDLLGFSVFLYFHAVFVK